ncbi:MAG: efflux RND transporter periplasmic adaptor subunit [Gammaproteobacteria bacterium]|jgi:membrane fusion protein (multidrug efflux system)
MKMMKVKMKLAQIKTDLQQKIKTNNAMTNMLIALALLFGLVLGYHLIAGFIANQALEEKANAPITVSTVKVEYQDWQNSLEGTGDTFPADGIEVTPLVDGVLREINVKSGQEVKKGDIIVKLNDEQDIAELESLKAQADLARSIYERGKEQFGFNAISKETLETDEYTWRMQEALVEQQKALVELKTIRAPFDGQIGIVKLSPGQLFQEGDPIVSLQRIDDLSIYFYLPEQYLPKVKIGQDVIITSETYPDKTFKGEVLAIDRLVDSNMHNIQVESSIENDELLLLPGMYVEIEVITGEPEKRLTIPQAAISYNPYGNYVYIVLKDGQADDGAKDEGETEADPPPKRKSKKKDGSYVKQRLVTLGDTRGDQVVVLKGLKEGDEIVSAGQLKLKNYAEIVINNKIQPSNDANPKVENETE